ncbi:MAG: hypothetical protein H7281_16605 [Bacteriovorax sp.]|nr:hypothetical protein [Bacteriovorax sp.]
MHTKLILLIILMVSSQSIFAEKTKSLLWKIQNETWNTGHEKLYQDFVHTLGMARKNGHCKTIDECLRSPIANPFYYNMNPNRLKNIFSDCADLPFILRAYFSWMNDLPFAYTTDLVAATSFISLKNDIRYSKFGNIVTAKRYVKNGDNINKILLDSTESISTASYRTNASLNDSGELFRDTYPVEIDRKSIVPGTVLYDANGHVAVVYDITSSGKILLIDAHPDNSLTSITYGEKFARTRVQIGGGFSNFRPFSVAGNRIESKPNVELDSYSLIQFQKGPFIFKGQEVSFYDYVRSMLADGVIIYNPTSEFTDLMDELCQDVLDREEAVNFSLKFNVDNQSHPEILPENIYGSDGDWELYATPSRDARLKASVREGKKFLDKMINGYLNHDPNIKYFETDLVKDLREIYLAKSKSCIVKVSPKIEINLDLVLMNLFALSFDPYHCAELRWGLTNTASCATTSKKISWFKAEQGLRNRIDRDYSMKTNYDVNTLPNAPVSNVEKPDLSFDQLLEIVR